MKQILIFFFLLLAVSSNAQEAVTTAGGSATVQGYNISWSIGEVQTETFVGIAMMITQGVQQPHKATVISHSSDLPDFQILVYPNPTIDFVTLNIPNEIKLPITLKIFDSVGKLKYTSQVTNNVTNISVAKLSAGIYLFQLIDTSKKVKIFKIIKQ